MVILSYDHKHSSESQSKRGNAKIIKADFGIVPNTSFSLGLSLTFELPNSLGMEESRDL